MAGLLSSVLAIVSYSAAKPINLLGPELSLASAASTSSLAPLFAKPTINESEPTLNVPAPITICYEGRGQADLIPDQCMEALVNSDFASLPPLETLAFASRSSPLSIGKIGLPRRYLSCMSSCPSHYSGIVDANHFPSGWQMCDRTLSSAGSVDGLYYPAAVQSGCQQID